MYKILCLFIYVYTFTYYIEQQIIFEDHVDYIEINHVYDNDCVHNYDQLIFWNHSSRKDWKYKSCVDWKIIKGYRKEVNDEDNIKLHHLFAKAGINLDANYRFAEFVGIEIQQDRFGNYYYEFFDRPIIRKVHFKSIIETWTIGDNETEHRKIQTVDERINLTKP